MSVTISDTRSRARFLCKSRKIFRVPIGTFNKESSERKVGKTCDLAFGYQGGLNVLVRILDKIFDEIDKNTNVPAKTEAAHTPSIRLIKEGRWRHKSAFPSVEGRPAVTDPS